MDRSDAPDTITLRGPHLVVLVGASGAGKSTWARARFLPTQVVSTDRCRALVGDREEVQAYSKQAFELFYFLIEKRMELDKIVVADSTALGPDVRRSLLALARAHGYPTVAVVFSAGLDVRRERNRLRKRRVDDDVLVRQQDALEAALQAIPSEGWDQVRVLGPDETERIEVRRMSSGVLSDVPPPYDVVGDIHGCLDELTELMARLGWERDGETYSHPHGRILVSLGDLADRGPDVPGVFRLWLRLMAEGKALFVPGNHDDKLRRYLMGRNVQVRHGLRQSVEQLEALPEPDGAEMKRCILRLVAEAPPYLVLDRSGLVVAHAGIKAEMIGRRSERIRRFVLYGDVTGERTPDGFPVRRDWAGEYRGGAFVAYGHTPVPAPVVRNRTVNIDQGCVFGGALTALRYPEMEFITVRARRTYYERPGGGGPYRTDMEPLAEDCAAVDTGADV